MRPLQHLCTKDGHVLQAQAVRDHIAKSALNAHLDCPLESAPKIPGRSATISNWPPIKLVLSDRANARLPERAAKNPPIAAPTMTDSNEMPSACSCPKTRSVNAPTTTGPTPTPINVTTAIKSATIKPWNRSGVSNSHPVIPAGVAAKTSRLKTVKPASETPSCFAVQKMTAGGIQRSEQPAWRR